MKSQSKFKTELTIEESARLIELGVDPKLASNDKVTYDKNVKPYHHPIYSLADLLSILPKEIYSEERDLSYFLTMVMPPHKCQAYYHRYSPKGFGPIMKAPELIDALNSLLIWCLTEKKINFNTEKK